MVLADQRGCKIHASVKKALVKKYERHIALDQWRIIENFSLGQVRGQFRVTNHQFKMAFVNSTFVSPCPTVTNDAYLSLPTFESIIVGELNLFYLVEVFGQVVNVGKVEDIVVNNESTKKLEFELRNEMNDRLPCTLWGKFADQVIQECENSTGEIVVCLIRFAKINTFRGENQITNAFDASVVTINPEFPEVEHFKNSLPKDGLALTISETNPRRELSFGSDGYFDHIFQVQKCKVMCKIHTIEGDFGWFYVACKKCSKKVEMNNKDKTAIADKPTKTTYWCPKCNLNITQVVPRFKLHVGVIDQTGDIKCIMFDSAASKMIGHSAFDLLDGVYDDDLQDPERMPPSIKNLVGKTFQLLVCIENDNLSGRNDTYMVGKVWPGVDIVMIEDADDSERASNHSHTLSNIERSIDDITVEGCSTTKKICLKPVKLEKLDEKNDEMVGNEEDEKKSGVNNEVNENPEPDYSEYAGL
ncbi:hypothetical protein AXX17_AT5G29550 [Arabidopsis thaliana]|uniref:Uncharacterized protein n=1 Tax=Arabidopsis thaliana TaxID=3702 RepID=A0A178UHW4_ARATH|nr:hypothetical protein AXX17_AT5G29550 [Arabidopsis thaliana]